MQKLLYCLVLVLLISAPKIITFLPNPLPNENSPFLSNPIPYPDYLYNINNFSQSNSSKQTIC